MISSLFQRNSSMSFQINLHKVSVALAVELSVCLCLVNNEIYEMVISLHKVVSCYKIIFSIRLKFLEGLLHRTI